jgi:alpha-tubulin suppressor-like RCC1 family protein
MFRQYQERSASFPYVSKNPFCHLPNVTLAGAAAQWIICEED